MSDNFSTLCSKYLQHNHTHVLVRSSNYEIVQQYRQHESPVGLHGRKVELQRFLQNDLFKNVHFTITRLLSKLKQLENTNVSNENGKRE